LCCHRSRRLRALLVPRSRRENVRTILTRARRSSRGTSTRLGSVRVCWRILSWTTLPRSPPQQPWQRQRHRQDRQRLWSSSD
jgi:hypothetical protein